MVQIDLEKVKKAYFIGIGGIGMSAIARMFLLQKKQVSGSDLGSSKITDELKKLGAKIAIGQSAENLPKDADLVVFTLAIPAENPELKAARAKKIPTLSYPEILGLISKEKFTIAVAGTHGKTTTTAMIAAAMIDAKLAPTVVVGSFLKDQKSNFIAGSSDYFLVEACEYKRSFLNLNPNILVITNIDDDHLDYYGTLEGVQRGFRELAEKLSPEDFLVCNPNDQKVKPILSGLACSVFDYSSVETNFKLKIPGKHNIENAKAALVAAGIVGIPQGEARKSLAHFGGTWRRFDFKGKTKSGVLVYQDYAHHPTEIRATLSGARELFPKQKIVTVFQPHLFSRTKEHKDEFAAAFSDADQILLAPIYAAREPDDKTISSEILAQAMQESFALEAGAQSKEKVRAYLDFKSIVEFLKKNLRGGDVLITMGAGDEYKIADEICDIL